MIIDSFAGLERYLALNPHFEKVFRYLRSTRLAELPEGTHEIDGQNAWLNVMVRRGKKVEEAPLEVHDSYIDIQMPLEGMETIGWRDRAQCTDLTVPYDEAKDVAFFGDSAEVFFTLDPYSLAILFPSDAHAPFIGEGVIKKIIVKVKVS